MQSRARFRILIVLALTLLGLPAIVGNAMASQGRAGAVYVQTNTAPNYVHVFHRSADGTLTPGPDVATGGAGTTVNPPFGLALTDSNYSVVLTPDNKVLLVTNNTSDNISTFRVLPDGNIAPADVQPSGGDFPNSIAVTRAGSGQWLVYVLNELSKAVTGFTLDRQGNLTPIAGSTRPVSGENSASVAFNPSGSVLSVTNRNDVLATPNGTISNFPVNRSTGLLGPEVVIPGSAFGAPFGLAYTRANQMLVANNGEFNSGLAGGATSYDVNPGSGAAVERDNEPVGGITCWVTISKNDKWAYFTGPGTRAVVGFQITHSSQLVPIGQTPTPTGGPLDLDTSDNGRYLYVLNTNINFNVGPPFPFNDSYVTAFAIDNGTGQLTPVGTFPAGSGGNSGLAAY